MIWILAGAILVAADQLTKLWAVTSLKGQASVSFIPKLLQFTYVENTGIAFGMLKGMHWLVIPINIVIMTACVLMARSYNKKGAKLAVVALCMIVSGAFGNMLDKIFKGYVVDFIETVFVEFPVFNVADILVCCGAALLCIYVVFFDKEEKNGNHL